MPVVGTVARLGLTPLKGASHRHPERVEVREHGAVGDRGWTCVERTGDGGWTVARTVRTPALLRVGAEVPAGGGLRLRLPGRADDVVPEPTGGDEVVADYWGRPAALVLAPGPWDDALSTLVGRPVVLARVSRPGDVVYAAPVVLLTTSTLRELGRRTGTPVDDERFRSLLLVDTGDSPPFVEDSWRGGVLATGAGPDGLRLVVGPGVARCAVVQRTPGSGERAADDLLGALAVDRVVDGSSGPEVVLGVGAHVARPGTLGLGDAVTLET
ncbi:MOSC N-terminal beta barrel domain-containing protein [Pseudokineococcus basanitobsidens]|uniref:MOSC N-terminal beta barrel domain-containing protein n=1 Tax=Pseudokineococcus basanitobsidens TaxID=1926649 RepID=A0ABU8RGG8_9ACTN